ncbi:hypothetical protein N9K06_00630 [Omnitrophica bacterium]|nr:hypothetical protein [Candidatus Omnitrophota bacterium]
MDEPIVLTGRDMALLNLAHEQRFLCYSQIRAAFWKENSEDAKACWHRVERLIKEGYLRKEYTGRKKLNLYLSTEKAVRELAAKSLDQGIPPFVMKPYYERCIEHDLNVTNVRILFRELGLHQWTSERVLWEREHQYNRPDAILTLRGRKIAIEFENGLTKSKVKYREMLEFYSSHEGYRLLFMVIKGDTRDWLVELEYDARKIWLAGYKELMDQREKTIFENKRGVFELSRLL